MDERADYTLNERMHAFRALLRFWDTLSGAVMFGAAGGPGFGINNYGGDSNGANDSLASGMDYRHQSQARSPTSAWAITATTSSTPSMTRGPFADTLGIPGINIGGNVTCGSPDFVLNNLPGGNGGTNGTAYGDGLNVNRCNCPLTEREDQFQIVNNWTKSSATTRSKWAQTFATAAIFACHPTATAQASSTSAAVPRTICK